MDHSVKARIHIADMLEGILSSGKVVLISKDAEGEYLGNADRKASAASTLEGCIEGMTDHPRVKTCLREDCLSRQRPQPLWCFGADKDSADGHSGVCKKCEAKRIGELGKKRKRRDRLVKSALAPVQPIVQPLTGVSGEPSP